MTGGVELCQDYWIQIVFGAGMEAGTEPHCSVRLPNSISTMQADQDSALYGPASRYGILEGANERSAN